MQTKVLQIESIEAVDLLTRLDRMEKAISEIASVNPPIAHKNTGATDYLTRREVADKFRISIVTVHDWTRKGIIQAYKIGNRVFYKPTEVENALVKKGAKYAR